MRIDGRTVCGNIVTTKRSNQLPTRNRECRNIFNINIDRAAKRTPV